MRYSQPADKAITWKFVAPADLRFTPLAPPPFTPCYLLVVAKEGGVEDWGAYIDTRRVYGKDDIVFEFHARCVAALGIKLQRAEALTLFPLFNPERYRD